MMENINKSQCDCSDIIRTAKEISNTKIITDEQYVAAKEKLLAIQKAFEELE